MVSGGRTATLQENGRNGASMPSRRLEGVALKSHRSLRNRLRYGQSLLESGVSGLKSGRDHQLHGQPLSSVLTQSAKASLSLATVGASAALLRLCASRRRRIPNAIAFGVIGSAIGFLAGFAWETRDLTAGMGRSALKEIGVVRDEHWLQGHPIDYA
jgi:hypothetical protein